MWHESNYVWISYFWSSLKGNGPEALVQTIVYGAIAVVFVPVARKWIARHFKDLHAKLDLAHEKMDHIIKHHPDIPDFEPKEKS